MIKDVTVYLDGSAADDVRIAHAAAVCSRFEAHLTGLYLNVLPAFTLTGDGFPMAAGAGWDLHDEALKTGEATMRSLATRLAAAVPLYELRKHDLYFDQFADVVEAQARTGDLTIMTRPYDEAAAGIDAEVAEAALFGSGRGVLFVPPTVAPAEFRRILVGWRDGREAARAVAEAMPLLRNADQVFLTLIDEDGAPARSRQDPAADIARHLDRHGVGVQVRYAVRRDRVADGLMDEATVTGADLIVAGAYGHSRLRELTLGGTTRDLLGQSPLPLFMAH